MANPGQYSSSDRGASEISQYIKGNRNQLSHWWVKIYKYKERMEMGPRPLEGNRTKDWFGNVVFNLQV